MQFNRSPFLLTVSLFVLAFSYIWLKPSKTGFDRGSVQDWLSGREEAVSAETTSTPKASVRAVPTTVEDKTEASQPVAYSEAASQPPATGVAPAIYWGGSQSMQASESARNTSSKTFTTDVMPVAPVGDYPKVPGAIYDPVFEQFAQALIDGVTDQPTGVYVAGVLALPILQQPANNPAYVSVQDGIITQFQSAARQGVTGLLAHNYLSGALFYNLQVGQEVRVVYGTGIIRRYRIGQVAQFQRLDFSRLDGDFIDLATSERLSSSSVFARFYSGNDHITFQTCLERDGRSNWGLIFVVAQPIW